MHRDGGQELHTVSVLRRLYPRAARGRVRMRDAGVRRAEPPGTPDLSDRVRSQVVLRVVGVPHDDAHGYC